VRSIPFYCGEGRFVLAEACTGGARVEEGVDAGVDGRDEFCDLVAGVWRSYVEL